jgi:F-type H+-transporting ATPase subunit gamma
LPGAGLKAINKRIRSVKNTQQITKAMKMVAAAKLQRSQGRMLAARPYSRKLTELLEQLAEATSDAADGPDNPLFEVRKVARRLVIVITSDKGLCGAYNMNIIKLAQKAVDASVAAGVETEIFAIGKKVRDFFRKRGYTIFAEHADFAGDISADRARGIGERAVSAFLDGTFDEVRLIYSQFMSTVRQVPIDRQLLPIAPEEQKPAKGKGTAGRAGAAQAAGGAGTAGGRVGAGAAAAEHGGAKDFIWEPNQAELYKVLLPLYLKNRVFMTLSEAFTSEHAARMTSMTAATDNAGELIDALTLKRNRERQAAITAELSDIVGGANAL